MVGNKRMKARKAGNNAGAKHLPEATAQPIVIG
jgi:hypothetical protein